MAYSPSDGSETPATTQVSGSRAIIHDLHEGCTRAVLSAVRSEHNEINAKSYALSTDLDVWIKVLEARRETALYKAASTEYVFGLLANAQAQYRNAFKSLRLVLELILQGAYLSVHIVALTEWLGSQADTSWQAILDPNRGVFAARYFRAFFPPLIGEASAFKALAETLYREMSECTHGNVPNKVPLPSRIAFDDATFTLWHEKAKTLRLIINFMLSVRYLMSLSAAGKEEISTVILDQLGHFDSLRRAIDGTASS